MKNIYLIVGESGSGKTSIVNALCDRYGFSSIESYTNRSPRYERERGHIFVSGTADELKATFPDRVAETNYNGNFYFATSQQADDNDFYVLDPVGVKFFKERYSGSKQTRIIYVKVLRNEREQRMLARGDGAEVVQERLNLDDIEFAGFEQQADYVVYNASINNAIKEIAAIVRRNK